MFGDNQYAVARTKQICIIFGGVTNRTTTVHVVSAHTKHAEQFLKDHYTMRCFKKVSSELDK